MDFFDIFIFNNVKLDPKITFYLPNKVVFKVKMLPLYRLYPYRKSLWAEVGQTYIWYKAFLYALVLTCRNLAVHDTICQKQSNAERLMRCIIYSSHWLQSFHRLLSRVFTIYLHWRGAFGVARFDKLGDARASTRGTSDRIGSALFRMYSNIS